MKYVKKSDGTLISSECDTVKVTENTLKKLLDSKGNADYLFYNFSGDVGSIISANDTENITSTQYMFAMKESENKFVSNIPNFNFKKVTNMRYMFNYRRFNSYYPIPLFDTSNVTDMVCMFQNVYFNGVNVPEYNTSNVKNMTNMFSFTEDISYINFDCKNVINMSNMFYSARFSNKYIINLKNTSNLINMQGMFSNAYNFTSAPLFDTSNVTNMSSAFRRTDITSIPLFNTSNVTNISEAFYNCGELLEIPKLNFSKLTSISYLFQNCSKLNKIDAIDLSNITNTNYAFRNCSSLKEFLPTGLKVSFDLSASTHFERADLVTMLNNLGTPTTTQTLTIGSTNLAKLTEEDIAIATQKNWTLQ